MDLFSYFLISEFTTMNKLPIKLYLTFSTIKINATNSS